MAAVIQSNQEFLKRLESAGTVAEIEHLLSQCSDDLLQWVWGASDEDGTPSGQLVCTRAQAELHRRIGERPAPIIRHIPAWLKPLLSRVSEQEREQVRWGRGVPKSK